MKITIETKKYKVVSVKEDSAGSCDDCYFNQDETKPCTIGLYKACSDNGTIFKEVKKLTFMNRLRNFFK